MRLLALSTGFAQRAGMLCCVLFTVMSAQALAQTSATDNPSPTAEQPSAPAVEKPAVAAEEKPAAADEKPAVVEQKPAPAEEKPAVAQEKPQEKPAAAKANPEVAQDKPASKQKSVAKRSESAVQSKRAEHGRSVHRTRRADGLLTRVAYEPRERTVVMFCTHFRTYDASSGTYRGYDRRTHSCR